MNRFWTRCMDIIAWAGVLTLGFIVAFGIGYPIGYYGYKILSKVSLYDFLVFTGVFAAIMWFAISFVYIDFKYELMPSTKEYKRWIEEREDI